MKTCHFKASRDITTIFGSGTLGNNINKWPKAGRHSWPPCMISDNFKIAILLYVYYMGAIETWPTLYPHPQRKNVSRIYDLGSIVEFSLNIFSLSWKECIRTHIINQSRQKLLISGCAIYIFASNSVNFWQFFKSLFFPGSLWKLPFCLIVGLQLHTLRIHIRQPC